MLEMKFILSIVYLISCLALANAADGAVSSSLRGSNNYPTLARDGDPVVVTPDADRWTSDCLRNCLMKGKDLITCRRGMCPNPDPYAGNAAAGHAAANPD